MEEEEMFFMPPNRGRIKDQVEDQAEVNRPERIVPSLAAKGRNEEGLEGVGAALPQPGRHCPVSWEVVWTENWG